MYAPSPARLLHIELATPRSNRITHLPPSHPFPLPIENEKSRYISCTRRIGRQRATWGLRLACGFFHCLLHVFLLTLSLPQRDISALYIALCGNSYLSLLKATARLRQMVRTRASLSLLQGWKPDTCLYTLNKRFLFLHCKQIQLHLRTRYKDEESKFAGHKSTFRTVLLQHPLRVSPV